jgi:hypothetical protein
VFICLALLAWLLSRKLGAQKCEIPVGNLEIHQADLPALDRRVFVVGVVRGLIKPNGSNPLPQQYRVGQFHRCSFWCVHVFPTW